MVEELFRLLRVADEAGRRGLDQDTAQQNRDRRRQMTTPTTTVAEKMIGDLEKINRALQELSVKGLPMSFILLYVNKKTRLPQRDIENVFQALRDLNREIQPKK